MTIAGFVVPGRGLAGFHSSKRQPLLRSRKLWEGVKLLSLAVIDIQGMPERNRKEPNREMPESGTTD